MVDNRKKKRAQEKREKARPEDNLPSKAKKGTSKTGAGTDTTPARPLPKLKILPPQLRHPASPAVDEDDIQLTSPPAIPEEELRREVDNYMVLNGFRDRADSKTGTSSEGEPEIEDTGSGRKRKWFHGGLEDSGEDDDAQEEDVETPGEDEDSEGSDEEEEPIREGEPC
jgi:hypothetical protein